MAKNPVKASAPRRAQIAPTDSPITAQAAQAGKPNLDAKEAVKEAKADGEDTITVTVPHRFHLTLNNFKRVTYEAGVQEMPVSHAEHKYAVANGVTPYKKARAAADE